MYDDESAETRAFAIEKMSELTDFNVLSPREISMIIFVGLSDLNPKVKKATSLLITRILTFMGVYENDRDKKMGDSSYGVVEEVSVLDKIQRSTSPIRHKHLLTNSPSRIFDLFDIQSFYAHPKFSNIFTLTCREILEQTSIENMKDYLEGIIGNMVNEANVPNKYQDLRSRIMSTISRRTKLMKNDFMLNDVLFFQSH